MTLSLRPLNTRDFNCCLKRQLNIEKRIFGSKNNVESTMNFINRFSLSFVAFLLKFNNSISAVIIPTIGTVTLQYYAKPKTAKTGNLS